jgi:hypothetical protein
MIGLVYRIVFPNEHKRTYILYAQPCGAAEVDNAPVQASASEPISTVVPNNLETASSVAPNSQQVGQVYMLDEASDCSIMSETVARSLSEYTTETADRIMGMIQTILAIVPVLLSVALGLMIYAYQRNQDILKEISTEARQAANDASHSKDKVEWLGSETETSLAESHKQLAESRYVEGLLQAALVRHDKIDEAVKDAQEKVEDANEELLKTTSRIESLERRLLGIEAQSDIQMRHVDMHNSDQWQRNNALSVLIQYSMDKNPILRWEIASIFTEIIQSETLRWAHPRVIDQLRVMALTDEVSSIRLQAHDALGLAGIHLDPPS